MRNKVNKIRKKKLLRELRLLKRTIDNFGRRHGSEIAIHNYVNGYRMRTRTLDGWKSSPTEW